MSSCTFAPQLCSLYQEYTSVSVTTRKKQNKAFPGREWGKGSVHYWLDWNHCGLDWKPSPSCSINLMSTIECYEAWSLWIDRNLAIRAVCAWQQWYDDGAVFMHFSFSLIAAHTELLLSNFETIQFFFAIRNIFHKEYLMIKAWWVSDWSITNCLKHILLCICFLHRFQKFYFKH